ALAMAAYLAVGLLATVNELLNARFRSALVPQQPADALPPNAVREKAGQTAARVLAKIGPPTLFTAGAVVVGGVVGAAWLGGLAAGLGLALAVRGLRIVRSIRRAEAEYGVEAFREATRDLAQGARFYRPLDSRRADAG